VPRVAPRARSPRPRIDHDDGTYDNQKLENLQAAVARLERGEKFDPTTQEASSPSIGQVFVKSEADHPQDEHPNRVRETTTNANDDRI
jgi:hypothetical protein